MKRTVSAPDPKSHELQSPILNCFAGQMSGSESSRTIRVPPLDSSSAQPSFRESYTSSYSFKSPGEDTCSAGRTIQKLHLLVGQLKSHHRKKIAFSIQAALHHLRGDDVDWDACLETAAMLLDNEDEGLREACKTSYNGLRQAIHSARTLLWESAGAETNASSRNRVLQIYKSSR